MFIWRNWLWCQAPCLLTAPTPATDEERKREWREHCGSGCLGPLPGQYLVSCYFLLAGPYILFWETLWKYTVPHALGDQFWQTRSKQKPTEFASHKSYPTTDKQIDSAGACCFPFFFPLSPAEIELSTRQGGKALLWLKDWQLHAKNGTGSLGSFWSSHINPGLSNLALFFSFFEFLKANSLLSELFCSLCSSAILTHKEICKNRRKPSSCREYHLAWLWHHM